MDKATKAQSDPSTYPGPVHTVRRGLGTSIWLTAVLAGVPTVAFLVVLPILALYADQDLATKMSLVQAATSWWGGVLAVIASIVALLAYRNSLQRPDLELAARNSLDEVYITLTNSGQTSASRPVVRIRFGAEGIFRSSNVKSEWKFEGFIQDGYYDTITWHGDDVVVHPGFDYPLPSISFSYVNASNLQLELPANMTWSCEGQLAKNQRFQLSFPSGR